MRLLQVITDTDRRGGQIFATDLGAELSRLGHEVTTVALTCGSKAEVLNLPILGRYRRGPFTLFQLGQRMRKHDITIAHGSATGLACALAGLATRKPFVFRQISETRFWAATPFRRWRVRWVMNRSMRVIALAAAALPELTDYLGIDHRSIRVIPNGVPKSRFVPATTEQKTTARHLFGLPSEEFVVLFVGELVPEKGVDVALHAISGLENVTLLVVGDGPERLRLEEMAKQVGCLAVFVGTLPDVLPAYHASDLMVFPSKGGDSMPAVLIEAGFCALPVVTTSIGAIPEMVPDGVGGVVLQSASSADFKATIIELSTDVSKLGKMGAVFRSHISNRYPIDIVGKKWESLLLEVLEH